MKAPATSASFGQGIMPVMSDFLLQRSSHELPRHMLPSKFILMQRLPLTANGRLSVELDSYEGFVVKSGHVQVDCQSRGKWTTKHFQKW